MPMPYEAKARESNGAEAPSVVEATEGETKAPWTSEAEAMEARVPRTAEAEVAGTRAPETTEAGVAGTGASETAEARVAGAGVSAAKPAAQEVELQRQKGLLADANELLSAWSVEVEDLRLCYADMKAEVAMAQEQVTPLATRVKELEEELTPVAIDWDTFWSRAEEATASAKALVGQLGAEEGAHLLAKGALVEALKVAEASWTEAVVWKGKVEELEKEVTWRALAIISSHYTGIDLEAISDSYVLLEAGEEVAKLMEAAKGPDTVLAKLFEEEVVPPTPSADAGVPKP
ncbi:uncharacterized protein [Miscanthus floridulus]|uniref:uncharacterized protein n=1 Tax=Miscanthus floridulus TaxID=154761 RepID=UPI0034577E49